MSDVVVGLLGPLSVSVAGRAATISSAKQSSIVAVLALEVGRAVNRERLIEIVWDSEPDERSEHTLQQHVSSLRKILEPDRAPRQEPTVLVTHRQGYALNASVDLDRFDESASAGIAAASTGRWDHALVCLDDALALWRGPALADVRTSTWMETAAARLEERRSSVRESRIEVMLAQGRHAELVPEIEDLVAANPFRERLWGQLMVALFRSGRQADALAAYGRARTELLEQLGLEPSAELRDLERRVLEQDPSLDVDGRATDERHAAPSSTGDLRETYRKGSPGVSGTVRLPDGQLVQLREGKNLIGRLPTAAIRLSDSRVSRSHAEIEVSGDRVSLRDLGSTNGTTLDGVEVREAELGPGDVFSVGGVELAYLI